MKRLTVVFLVAAFAAALVPQALEAGVGLKAGFSLAKISESPAESLPWKNLPFFVGGLSFEGGLGIISLQPEILYVRMGAKYTADADNGLEFRHDYIQVPVLIKLNIIPAGPLRPFICGGGYGSYLIKAEGVMKSLGVTTKADLTEEYQRFDYGVVGGLGLAFKLPVISLSVEGRYTYGLMNIIKNPGEGEAVKNRCLMALVGVGF